VSPSLLNIAIVPVFVNKKHTQKRLISPLYSNKIFLNLRQYPSTKVKKPKDHNGLTSRTINALKAIDRMTILREIKLKLDTPEGLPRHLSVDLVNKTLTTTN
jgi:hypothetical protein